MNILSSSRENISHIAHALNEGKLAVLPTETVYGLAADAWNVQAVEQIFSVKGRPNNNPLIVHLSSLAHVDRFVSNIPDALYSLADAFMPGPLTLVLPKHPDVPSVVSGGLDTVAIRIPDHPVCLGVMELGDLALAMPSANPFMSLSPTSVEMIDVSIGDNVEGILDGGPCKVGIESTVLDLTGEPTILRPGIISQDEIEIVLKQQILTGGNGHKSPGMYKRHYSPRTTCKVAVSVLNEDPGLVFCDPANSNQIQMPSNPKDYARNLYASLSDLDCRGLEKFYIQAPPETADWAAVWDRITKAAA